MKKTIMIRIRTIRDITCQVGREGEGGRHIIQRGTYFYALGDYAAGFAIDIPDRQDPLWLFVGEDVVVEEDPLPF